MSDNVRRLWRLAYACILAMAVAVVLALGFGLPDQIVHWTTACVVFGMFCEYVADARRKRS